jgi:hypothetical protein
MEFIKKLAVQFGSSNVGENSVSLAVKIPVEDIEAEEFDVWFRHRMLSVEVADGDYTPGTMHLGEVAPLLMACEVKSVSANRDHRKFTLKAPVDDRVTLGQLANTAGTLILWRSDEIPDIKKQSGKKKRVSVPPMPVDDLRQRRFSILAQYGLSALAAGSIERNNFATVGECIDWIQQHGQSWGDVADPKVEATGDVVDAIARASE